MSETISFHFEGALADSHRMNFYESARFQYAAARLLVKLDQFRDGGRFVEKISNKSNRDITLVSQSDGSFNINVEDPGQPASSDEFILISIADLLAYVTERLVEKIDATALARTAIPIDSSTSGPHGAPEGTLDLLIDAVLREKVLLEALPTATRELVKRRMAETFRERRLADRQGAIAKIDFARSQKLIAMSAPLVSEMATALRRSATTLEVISTSDGREESVLFLDRRMAQEIETAVVDRDITPILGDITQFNKDNGWGKLKIEEGAKLLSFSIPSDILPSIKQTLIDNMKRDLVYLQTYFVRDRSDEVVRLIAVGVLPTPTV